MIYDPVAGSTERIIEFVKRPGGYLTQLGNCQYLRKDSAGKVSGFFFFRLTVTCCERHCEIDIDVKLTYQIKHG
jgi:hypothetical protein